MNSARNRRHSAPAQRGQVFLVLVLLIVVGAGALVYSMATPGRDSIERDKITAAALAQAREGLISYASAKHYTGSDRPGTLPCPDSNGLGNADNFCGTEASRIGRLPWKTLGLSDLRDGHGEPLWYAVSDTFKRNPVAGILNSNTPGGLSVSGSPPASNVIAIVFAPGPVLGNQNRSSSISSACSTTGTSILNHRCAANYLEGGNENADTAFFSGPVTSTFNDKLLLITHGAFFHAVEMRVARAIRESLIYYFSTHSYLPYANSYAGPATGCLASTSGRVPLNPAACGQDGWSSPLPSWFGDNNWQEVLFYAVAPSCTSFTTNPCDGGGGYLTVDGATGIRALLFTPGRALTGQNRPCAATSDCLEDAENTNGDTVYARPTFSTAVNDRLVVVSP